MNDPTEIAKEAAAHRAVDEQLLPLFTNNNSASSSTPLVIGIGSGSTIPYAVSRISHLTHQSPPKLIISACIPTSFQAEQLIVAHNLPLGTLNQFTQIDLTIDGADEVDANLDCIKGGGGCLLQEKLVAFNSSRLVVVADDRKRGERLGTKVNPPPLSSNRHFALLQFVL